MSRPYLRYPHLHDDLVTFVADDDVWLAPVAGGRAWRLTSDHVPCATPRTAPDGSRVAYLSHRDGHPEVYVVDLDGGAPRRLTWFGGMRTLLLGWDDDGRVLVATNGAEHHRWLTVVYAVALDGSVERLRFGPAWGVATHGSGVTALVSAGYRPAVHWKRYRGGTASRLWLDRAGDGTWEQALPVEQAAVLDPMWLGDTLLFTSDRAATFPDNADEQANLWAWDGLAAAAPGEDGTPAAPRQVTFQTAEQGYVRDATTDGARVVWHSRGDLWLLDSLNGTPRRLDITLTGAAPLPYAAAPGRIDGLATDHGGDGSLVGWLGTAFWVTHRAGPARALVADPAERVREPDLLGDTGRAVVVTDADGEDALEAHSLDGSTASVRFAGGSLGRVLHLAASPDGARVATISHDGRISLITVPAPGEPSSSAVIEMGRSVAGEAEGLAFSPDGRYLAWSSPTGNGGDHHCLMVADLHEDSPVGRALTSGKFHDRSPAFTDDGKYLVLLSDRTFDPSYDAHEFALSFGAATRPWLIPLSAAEPAPFGPSVDGWRLSKHEDKKHEDKHDDDTDGGKPADTAVPSPDIDFDGAEERIVPFPVTSGRYRGLRAAKGGVLWIRESDDAGVLGARNAGAEADGQDNSVQFWSFDERKSTDVAEKVDDYAVSGDGRRIVVRSGNELTTQPATAKPGDDPGPDGATEVDLSRMRYEVDPRAQWRQMFEENARIMRDHYWRADMNGVDWDAAVARWRPVVERVATHDDLTDLLWETVGELNTSHAYISPPGQPGETSRRLGFLGADLSPAGDGWRIDRILPGESSDPAARSPLRAAGVDARPGDVIVAVDGRPVDPAVGPAANLTGAAEHPVELKLRREGVDRRVVVVPLADESVLRYQAWVASRREYVAEKSGGRLGYVHVPDMTSNGWAQMFRDLRQAVRREGLVVDVRFNGGGHTSQLVISRIARRIIGWDVARHHEQPMPYPDNAPRGSVVLVTNEHAGSDGDIVNAAAQALDVGPVVGVRTWGGVVGIDGRFDLVDGTSITQPRYAFWLEGPGWDVENHGVAPDIEVWHTPADYFGETDKQLDVAIAESFRLLEEHPAAEPPELPEPRVRR